MDLERFSTALRRAPLAAINNSPQRAIADRKYGAYIRPKLHRFDLSLYVLQSWLYNKSIKWSLSIIVQIGDNNRTFCYRPSLVACSGRP